MVSGLEEVGLVCSEGGGGGGGGDVHGGGAWATGEGGG